MLPQQVLKVLLKLVEAVQNNDNLTDYQSCDSFHLIPALQTILLSAPSAMNYPHQSLLSGWKCQSQTESEIRNINHLLPLFQYRTAHLLVGVAEHMNRSMTRDNLLPSQAWNCAQVEMARTSRAYSQYLLLNNFVNGIKKAVHVENQIGMAEEQVLLELACLLALYWIEREMGDFLEANLITMVQAQWIRYNVTYMLNVIRPNAVALVDAREFTDFRLKSSLGQYNGNVYPSILAAAQKDPLNQIDPGPGYQEHLRRLIVGGVGCHITAKL
jgi:acyl-CoA oxidase